jgi:cyclic pyranopterin monophosphate synthase
MSKITHLDDAGRARMVDVGDKPATARSAVAEGTVRMSADALAQALAGDAKKGDVRAVAEIAGVMAAKRTADLIPLCHPLPLTLVDVQIRPDAALPGFTVNARVRTSGPTGVEMEALMAVSVACLAIYDMLKAVDRDMCIEQVRLLEKSGGGSGDYRRSDAC